MSRTHDPTRARRHWVYSRAELCELLSISESTVTNWIADGLEPIDAVRPQLFSGFTVHGYLNSKRWPNGRNPEHGRLYCSACLSFQPLRRDSIQSLQHGIGCLKVTGLCTDCDNLLQASIRVSDYAEIFNASANTPGDSSDVMDEGVSSGIGRNRGFIEPESNSSSPRWLHAYRVYRWRRLNGLFAPT